MSRLKTCEDLLSLSSVSEAPEHRACVPSVATWSLHQNNERRRVWACFFTWREVSTVTRLRRVLSVLARSGTSEESLLFDLDHLERVAVPPLSGVLTL